LYYFSVISEKTSLIWEISEISEIRELSEYFSGLNVIEMDMANNLFRTAASP